MSVVLLPGLVTVAQVDGSPAFYFTSGVTGTGPILGDGSDDTFATIADGSNISPANAIDVIRVTVPQLDVSPSAVTDIGTSIRAAADPPSGFAGEYGASITVPSVPDYGPFLAIGNQVAPMDGTTRTTASSMRELYGGFGSFFETILLEFATTLAAGPTEVLIQMQRTYTGPPHLVGRFYEVTLTVATAAAPQRRRVLTEHPTRRYPRDDGNGTSPARRNYPPPRAGRTFGAQT